MLDPFIIADTIGIVFFTISGALVAIRSKLDLLGLFIAAFLTALGGGIIRDTILQRPPSSFVEMYPALFVLFTLFIVLTFKWYTTKNLEQKLYFVISDTIGLVSFSITGSLLALEAHFNIFGVIILSFTTAVGGGMIRDIMINEVPQVLISNFYGSVAVLIALTLLTLDHYQLINTLTLSIVFIASIALRLLAYYKEWKLPVIQ